ncbi:EGF-like domain-containing protein [Aphelenchoides fujianensis]|nr:EGF-like domain-containing protein [Aphelenchoides fujianensis]
MGLPLLLLVFALPSAASTLPKAPKCAADEFACVNFMGVAACVPSAWRCDGKQDCLLLEDERNCTRRSAECAADEFRCAHRKMCVDREFHCDGSRDCSDHSDEEFCELVRACDPQTEFMCPGGEFCVSLKRKCDGVVDCPDRSDELNCPVFRKMKRLSCPPKCVSRHFVCDGESDCADGSDEQGAICEQKRRCKAGDKICANGICLPERYFCNGEYDCSDGSDESNCPPLHNDRGATCPPAHFRCDVPRSCIPFDRLCATAHATDDCLISECHKDVRFCFETDPDCKCRAMYTNFSLCYCPAGFHPLGGRCIDVDECRTPGTCAQTCTNLKGSYSCSCRPGFELYAALGEGVASKCRARGANALLLLSSRDEIRQFDLVDDRYRLLATELSTDILVDYWHRNGTIIWSDSRTGQLITCKAARTPDKNGLLQRLDHCVDDSVKWRERETGKVKGMAIDWVHGLLFTSVTSPIAAIEVFDLFYNHHRSLLSDGLDEPGAIVVDPSVGLLFWTDIGVVPRIERAGMDGGDRMQIVTQNEPLLRWPTALAIDTFDRRLYWADVKSKAVLSVDYYGEDLRVVMRSFTELGHPFSMALFEDRLFLTDVDREGVLVMNKFDGSEAQTLLNGMPGPTAIRVFHEQQQPDQRNLCANHTCDNLCLPMAQLRANSSQEEQTNDQWPTFMCLCSDGFKPDPKTTDRCVPHGDEPPEPPAERPTERTPSSRLSRRRGIVSTLAVLALVALVGGAAFYAWKNRRPEYSRTSVHFENPAFEVE